MTDVLNVLKEFPNETFTKVIDYCLKFQWYPNKIFPRRVFLKLCFKVRWKISFLSTFLSFVETQFSRNWETLGQKGSNVVSNFGYLAILLESRFSLFSKNKVKKYIRKIRDNPGQSWLDKPQFWVTFFLTFFESFEKQLQLRIARCPKVDNTWKPFCPSVDPVKERE